MISCTVHCISNIARSLPSRPEKKGLLDVNMDGSRVRPDLRTPRLSPGLLVDLGLKATVVRPRRCNRFRGRTPPLPSRPAAGNSAPDISGVNGVWLAAPCCAAAVTVHSCEDREDSQEHGRAAKLKMSPAIFGTVPLYNRKAADRKSVV